MCGNLVDQFFTCVRIWYQLSGMYTCNITSMQLFTRVSFDTNFSTCDELIPFFHRYKGLVPNLHTSEYLVPIFHIMLVLHTLKTIQMWNFSTYFTPQILSKLTVRKFHIYQKWSIGSKSLHGVKFTECENFGSTRLPLTFVMLDILRTIFLPNF